MKWMLPTVRVHSGTAVMPPSIPGMGAWISQRWYAIVPALTALALGLWGIGSTGPWLDEMFTIEAVTDGLGSHLWDAPMLPYYAFMWLWTLGGTVIDSGWLRLPSVLAVGAAACIVAVTARRLGSPQAGFTAGMLIALAPGVSRYAHEARAYALALALVSLATFCLVTLADDARPRWWGVYGVAMALATLLLPVSLAAMPAHAAILSGLAGDRRWQRWGAGLLVTVPVAALAAALAYVFGVTRAWLRTPEVGDLPLGMVMQAGSGAFGLAVIVIGLFSSTGRRWVLGLAGSVTLVWITSVTVSNWWLERAFIPLSGVACVAAGLACTRLALGWVIALLTLMGALAAPGLVSMREAGSRGADPEAIAAVIDAEARKGDGVLSPGDLDLLWWDRPDADRTVVWWSVHHYLRDDPRDLRRTTAPSTGRYWEGGDVVTCSTSREWVLAAGERLRLCLS